MHTTVPRGMFFTMSITVPLNMIKCEKFVMTLSTTCTFRRSASVMLKGCSTVLLQAVFRSLTMGFRVLGVAITMISVYTITVGISVPPNVLFIMFKAQMSITAPIEKVLYWSVVSTLFAMFLDSDSPINKLLFVAGVAC